MSRRTAVTDAPKDNRRASSPIRLIPAAFSAALCALGCASDTALYEPTSPTNVARPRCPAPASISDEDRRTLRAESIQATDEEASRLACGGTFAPPHWVALPADAAMNVCADPQGIVYDVTTDQSTGDETFDKLLRIEVRTWRYLPVVRDGKPTPFCHRLNMHFPDRE